MQKQVTAPAQMTGRRTAISELPNNRMESAVATMVVGVAQRLPCLRWILLIRVAG